MTYDMKALSSDEKHDDVIEKYKHLLDVLISVEILDQPEWKIYWNEWVANQFSTSDRKWTANESDEMKIELSRLVSNLTAAKKFGI